MPKDLLIKRSDESSEGNSSNTEEDEAIIDVGREPEKPDEAVSVNGDDDLDLDEEDQDHRVPESQPTLASPIAVQARLPLMPGGVSPLDAYTRLWSDEDYARYRACKDSAQAFYSRLATLTALQSYYMQQNQQQTTTSSPPSAILQQYQSLLAARFSASMSSSPLGGGQAKVGLPNLTLKNIGLGSPPIGLPGMKRSAASGSDDSPKMSPGNISASTSTSASDSGPSPAKKAKGSSSGSGSQRRKVARKLAFDEDKTSPVSGTIIRELADGEEVPAIRKGDIPPEFNVVEVTEEAKAELAKIENKIGDYCCRLCKEVYPDAFGLAQHRCSMIVHVEYRCPECDKVFNCPANLASHRRWHKPRGTTTASQNNNNNNDEENNNNNTRQSETGGPFACDLCIKTFKRAHSLRKHIQQSHNKNEQDGSSPISSTASVSSNASSGSLTSPSRYSIADLLSPSKSDQNKLEQRPVSPPTLQCRFCPENFTSFPELTQHLSKHQSQFEAGGLLQPIIRPRPTFLTAFPH